MRLRPRLGFSDISNKIFDSNISSCGSNGAAAARNLSRRAGSSELIGIGGVSIQKWGKNRLGEVAKEAFSSGVETTFPCEQITIGVTSFGELLYQRRSQRRPKQK